MIGHSGTLSTHSSWRGHIAVSGNTIEVDRKSETLITSIGKHKFTGTNNREKWHGNPSIYYIGMSDHP
jgi:hypothetical protein